MFLVDDQQMVRAGFRMLVESQDDMVVVSEAGDGGDAVAHLAVTAADVVLMDVRMPRMDGVEATTLLLAQPDPPRVIVLTTFDLDDCVSVRRRWGRVFVPVFVQIVVLPVGVPLVTAPDGDFALGVTDESGVRLCPALFAV